MERNYSLLLSVIFNVLAIATPIVLILLIVIYTSRRMQRIEARLAELVEEVKKLTPSKEIS